MDLAPDGVAAVAAGLLGADDFRPTARAVLAALDELDEAIADAQDTRL